MDGKSQAMHNNNCACCGLISKSAKDGLCLACYELLLKPTITMVDAANQTEPMPPSSSSIDEDELELQGNKTVYKNNSKKTETKLTDGSSNNNSPTTKPNNSTKLSKSSKIIKKKLKNCCLVCKKKIGLYAVQCRCGGVFCAFHRYSDRHDCKFDYRAWGAAEILRNNPRVVATKIEKI